MPYAPGISYQGGDYLAQGILGLGRGIGGGIEEWKKKHDQLTKDLGESDTIVEYAMKTGAMSPEQYTKYLQGSATQKTGIAEGIAKNQLLNTAEQHFQAEQAYRYAALRNAMDIAQIHAAASGAGQAAVNPQTFQLTDPTTGKPFSVFTQSPRSFQLTPGSAAEKAAGMVEHTPGETYYDPTTGQPAGVWESKDKVKFTPQKKGSDMMEMFKAAGISPEGEAGPKLPQATTADKIMNFLRTGPMGPATPPTVKTQEEIDMLPPDAAFYVEGDPSHTLRRKKQM